MKRFIHIVIVLVMSLMVCLPAMGSDIGKAEASISSGNQIGRYGNLKLSLSSVKANLAGVPLSVNSSSTGSSSEQTTWICEVCGTENTGKYCTECGHKKDDSWICPVCGETNTGKFCHECGHKKDADLPDPTPTVSTNTNTSQDNSSKAADDAFMESLEKLKKAGEISSLDGDTTNYGDYEKEWAQIGWYQWVMFENAKRFVISAEVSWDSASPTPNTFESGCGIVFNANDNTNDHLLMSLRMDGMVYFTGKRNGRDLSYGVYKFGSPSISKTVDLLFVADNGEASVYINGKRIVKKAGMVIQGDSIGLSTISGTNKDFGTRCTWKDIKFYTW